MLASFRRSIGALAALSALTWAGGVANAHSLKAEVTQWPTGPGTQAKVKISFVNDGVNPAPTEISGFNFAVLFEAADASLAAATPLSNANGSVGYSAATHDPALNYPPAEVADFDSMKVVNGTESNPDPLVPASPWDPTVNSGELAELTFTMAGSYDGSFDFEIRQYAANNLVNDEDNSPVANVSVEQPDAVYSAPVISTDGVSPDGTFITDSTAEITIDGSGFYNGVDGAPQSKVFFGTTELLNPTISYNQITVNVPVADLASVGADQVVAVTVQNVGDGSPVSNADNYYVVDRQTVYVDHAFSGDAGDAVSEVSPYKVLGANAYTTIQGGVNDVTLNGTVDVAAGEYVENVQIARAMTLEGAQAGNVANGRTGSETVVKPAVNDPINGTIPVFAFQANNITLNGFTVDGQNASAGTGEDLGDGELTNAAVLVRAYNGGSIPVNHVNVSYNKFLNTSTACYFGRKLSDLAVVSQNNEFNYNSFENVRTAIYATGLQLRIEGNFGNNVGRLAEVQEVRGNFDPLFNPGIINNEIHVASAAGYHRPVFDNSEEAAVIFYNTRRGQTEAKAFAISENEIYGPGTDISGKLFKAINLTNHQSGNAPASSIELVNNIIDGNGSIDHGIWGVELTVPVTVRGGSISECSIAGITADSSYPTGTAQDPCAIIADGAIVNAAAGTVGYLAQLRGSVIGNSGDPITKITLINGAVANGAGIGVKCDGAFARVDFVKGAEVDSPAPAVFANTLDKYVELVNAGATNPYTAIDAREVDFGGADLDLLAGLKTVEEKIVDRRDLASLGDVLLFGRVSRSNDSVLFDYIQEAVSDAGTPVGATITAAAGWYPETNGANTGLVIAKDVTINGPNAGIAGVTGRSADRTIEEAIIVPGVKINELGNTADQDYDALIEVAAAGVTIDGFKISGDNTAITSGLYAGMDHEANLGIYAHADNVLIVNNLLENFTYAGIEAFADDAPNTGLSVQNNLIRNVHDIQHNGWGYGIVVADTAGTITNNWIESVRKGIQTQVFSAPAGFVQDNDIFAWERGIYLNYNRTGGLWTVHNNRISGIAPNAAMTLKTPWDGIRVETIDPISGGGAITANTINGSVAQNDAIHDGWGEFGDNAVFGIRFAGSNSTSDDVSFTGNNISNVQHAFVHESPAAINTFSGNTLAAVGDYVRLQPAYDFAGNTADVGGVGSIDATAGNTFGSEASATALLPELYDIEDKVTHKLDDSDLGLVRVKTDHLYVTQLSNSIQRGIDAADEGDTVNVEAGTYAEAVKTVTTDADLVKTALWVNKASVKVLGPNRSNRYDGTREAEAYIVPASVVGGISTDSNVVYIGADGSEFKGFTVKADNGTNSGNVVAGLDLEAGSGICSLANNVLIENNIVDGASYVGLRSAGYVVGNPTYDNFEGVRIIGNLVKNVHSLTVGHAIYMQGSTGEVSWNKVENARQGMQIQPYNKTGTLTVTKNTIEAYHRGLWVNSVYPVASAFDIVDNTITATAVPASLGLAPIVWEGIRMQGVNSTAGVTFDLNKVDGSIAQADAAHDVPAGKESVFGIYTIDCSSDAIDLNNNRIEEVTKALVHTATAELLLTANTLIATDQAISVQQEVASNGTLGTEGGTGNIDATGGNTYNGIDSAAADISLAQLYDIEDDITHKVDTSALGLVRVIARNIYVTGSGNNINKGVIASEDGDTISVKDGTYGDAATIDKFVTVQSAPNALDAVISAGVLIDIPSGSGTLKFTGFAFDGGNVTVDGTEQSGSNFEIADCTFTNGAANSAAVGVNGAINGLIDNISVAGSGGHGVVIANSLNVTVQESDFVGNDGSGILVWKWDAFDAEPQTVDGIKILNNQVISNGVTYTNDTFTVDNSEAYGILVAMSDDDAYTQTVAGPSAVNLQIKGNVIRDNAATGLFLSYVSSDGTGENVVSGNTIENNGLSGTVVGAPVATKNTDGVKINSSRNIDVQNNFIHDNQRFGIQVRSLVGEVDAGTGVDLTFNHIDGNVPMNYANNGVFIGGGLLMQLAGDPSKEIVATNNWWGHVYGPFNAVENSTGRGDAYVPQDGTADVSNWYGKREYYERWWAVNDRDGDGIWDADEDLSLNSLKESLESNRAVKDTDGDGYEDGAEVAMGWDPLVKLSDDPAKHELHDLQTYAETSTEDTDGDGYLDFYEVALGSNPNHVAVPDATKPDTPLLGEASMNANGTRNGVSVADDVSMLRRVIVLNKELTDSGVYQDNMDVNRDGAVSNTDAIALRRFCVSGTQANGFKLPMLMPGDLPTP